MTTITIQRPKLMGNRTAVYLWETLTETDSDGGPLDSATFSDKTVQVVGDFGSGGIVVLEGSNDGTNWETLSDAQGNALSFTSAGMEIVLENPFQIRPFVTDGISVDVDVYLCVKGAQ